MKLLNWSLFFIGAFITSVALADKLVQLNVHKGDSAGGGQTLMINGNFCKYDENKNMICQDPSKAHSAGFPPTKVGASSFLTIPTGFDFFVGTKALGFYGTDMYPDYTLTLENCISNGLTLDVYAYGYIKKVTCNTP